MKSLKDFIFEMLNHTSNSNDLINKIKNEFDSKIDSIFEKDVNSKYKTIEISSKYASSLCKDNKFEELCNFANYEIKYDEKDPYKIYLKPIKGKEVTNDVYKFPEIYHITPKFIYDEKIKGFGLSPKAKSGKFHRLYFYYNEEKITNFNKTFIRFNKRFKLEDTPILKDKLDKGYVLLTIDLSKLNRKIKFYEDSGIKGMKAFWTFDFIPDNAIINVENIEGV